MPSQPIFRDSDEDRSFRAKPDDPLPTNTGLHRFVGALLGVLGVCGGFDLMFGVFHVFEPAHGAPTSYSRFIGLFFITGGIFLIGYVLAAGRRAQKSPVSVIVTGVVIFLLFLIPRFFH